MHISGLQSSSVRLGVGSVGIAGLGQHSAQHVLSVASQKRYDVLYWLDEKMMRSSSPTGPEFGYTILRNPRKVMGGLREKCPDRCFLTIQESTALFRSS